MGIDLLDHVIIAKENFVSLRELGFGNKKKGEIYAMLF